MARPRSNDPIGPMTLQNMRENGVRCSISLAQILRTDAVGIVGLQSCRQRIIVDTGAKDWPEGVTAE